MTWRQKVLLIFHPQPGSVEIKTEGGVFLENVLELVPLVDSVHSENRERDAYEPMFSDCFKTGDTILWSASVP